MATKKLRNISIDLKNLIIFSYILSIIPVIQAFSFKYPTALTLKDKKILVVHSLGIDICDSQYTTNNNIIEFTNEITESNLSKISISKYSTGEILILIIDTIYLFDEYGQKLIKFQLRNSYNADYFTLSAHDKFQDEDNQYYYYLFGYIDNSSLKL